MVEHQKKTTSGTKDADEMRRKKKSPEPMVEHIEASTDESIPFSGFLGLSARELPLERHGAVLSDSRFSNSANNVQKARMVTELQQNYGNAYIQRAVSLIQAKKDEAISEEKKDVPDIGRRIAEEKGSGQPLELETRSEMEDSFGKDFSNVRIHTDAEADKLSRGLGAKAFTTGKDIFFREGAYEANSGAGKSLLGHELAHVVQQPEVLAAPATRTTMGSEPAETEAKTVAQALTSGRDFSVSSQVELAGAVARREEGDEGAKTPAETTIAAPDNPSIRILIPAEFRVSGQAQIEARGSFPSYYVSITEPSTMSGDTRMVLQAAGVGGGGGVAGKAAQRTLKQRGLSGALSWVVSRPVKWAAGAVLGVIVGVLTPNTLAKEKFIRRRFPNGMNVTYVIIS